METHQSTVRKQYIENPGSKSQEHFTCFATTLAFKKFNFQTTQPYYAETYYK